MSATRRSKTRVDLDQYNTPQNLALACCAQLLADGWVAPGGVVLEPSAGTGNFMFAVEDTLAPMRVEGVEIQRREYAEHTVHCLDFEDFKEVGWTLIIGNPPYTHAERHTRHALSLLGPGGTLAFVLRIGFLESLERAPLWREHPPVAVYSIRPRPDFTGNGGDQTAYGLFVWRNARRLNPPMLGWIDWDKPKKRKSIQP